MTGLREIRLQKGMSLAKLAFDAKNDEGFLSKLERGMKAANPVLQERLAGILGVGRSNLFNEDGTAK